VFEPPGQLLVYDVVSPCAKVVRLSSGDSHKLLTERFFTVACWRMSLNTSLPSRIVPDPYRIGNGCTRSTTFPSTSTSTFFNI
jgi:hypothetical protein